MDIALALNTLIPAAQYAGSLTANTEEAYQDLAWEDSRIKPTWPAIELKWQELEIELAWDAIRQERGKRLFATDWAVLPDSPPYSQALLDYRQALRDLPQDFATPESVVWPQNPLEI